MKRLRGPWLGLALAVASPHAGTSEHRACGPESPELRKLGAKYPGTCISEISEAP